MSGKVIVMSALLVALLVSSAASSPGEATETDALQRLLAKRERARDLSGRQQPAPQAHMARVERRAHLTEDEREIATKQIMQAISGMLWVSGVWKCLSNRFIVPVCKSDEWAEIQDDAQICLLRTIPIFLLFFLYIFCIFVLFLLSLRLYIMFLS